MNAFLWKRHLRRDGVSQTTIHRPGGVAPTKARHFPIYPQAKTNTWLKNGGDLKPMGSDKQACIC